MKVILVMVASADGKTTRGDESSVNSWSSQEDYKHFEQLKSTHKALVMGRTTFESIKDHINPSANMLRIVLTNHPAKFIKYNSPGQLEFSHESPTKLVSRLKKKGYKSLIVAGGSKINKAFFEEKLITECYLTLEPKLFGSGKNIIAKSSLDINLTLLGIKQLNARGTTVLHYKVEYDRSSN